MSTKRLRQFAVALGATVAISACVASPDTVTAPSVSGNNLLAVSFDSIAKEQTEAGDTERSEEFAWAALAIRAGVTPSTFTVTNNGQTEVYSAFVHAATWTLPTLAIRPVGHRTLVAWRKNGDAMQVIIVSSHTDVAPVMHPYSMRLLSPGGPLASPVAAASAGYFERLSNKSAWMGISGQVKMAELSVSGACASPTANAPPAGVTCQLATFNVGFDITFAKTKGNESRVVDQSSATRKLTASDQTVAGVKLTFACISPSSAKGCG